MTPAPSSAASRLLQLADRPTSRRRLLAGAVLLGFVLRLGFALGYWVDKPLTVDQVEYLMLAENLAQGRGLVYDEGPRRLMRSPGYPVFLAAVRALHPGVTAIKLVQSLIGAFTVLLVAAIARRVAGHRAMLVAAFVAAVYPPLIFLPAYVLSETLYTALSLSLTLLLWNGITVGGGDPPPSPPRMAAGGALAGVTVLTRPELLLFVGLLALLLLGRRQLAAALVFVACTGAVILPWAAYNRIAHDRVVLISSRGGPNFWMGNNPLAIGDGDTGAVPRMSREYNAIQQRNPDLSAEELERLFYRKAFDFIRKQPVAWLANQARKIFYFLVPVGPSYSSHSRLYWLAQAFSYLLLLPFAVAGFRRVARQRRRPVLLWLLAASAFLTCFIFFPLPRYRVPAFDPVMIVCAAALVGLAPDGTRRSAAGRRGRPA